VEAKTMRKFKLNKSKTNEPSAESMKRYKDFATLSHQYERIAKRPKKPIYKDPKLFLFLLIIGLIALFLFVD
jgi:hypothetical protein